VDQTEYVALMTPTVRWAARRYGRPGHPLLAPEELERDGIEALLTTWNAYYPRSPDDLARLGRRAVLNKFAGVRSHAMSRGERDVAAWVDLDLPLIREAGEDAPKLSEILGAEGIEDVFFWFGLDELDRSLDDVARAVLGELLDPGVKTLRAVRRAWKARAGRAGNWWAGCRAAALAAGAGVKGPEVTAALHRIRLATKKIFVGEPPGDRYRDMRELMATRGGTTINRGDMSMGTEKGFIPDDPAAAFDLPEPGAAPAAAKAEGKKAAGTKADGKATGTKKKTGSKGGATVKKASNKTSVKKAAAGKAAPKKAAASKGDGKLPQTKIIEAALMKGAMPEQALTAVKKVYPDVVLGRVTGHVAWLKKHPDWTVKVDSSGKVTALRK
jgi:hypothetical protein